MKQRKEKIDEVLSDQEKLAIQMFMDNEVQREAVKKVLMFGVYHNGTLRKDQPADPLLNFTLGLVSNAAELKMSDADLGSQLRAAWEGVQFVELAWSMMSSYKKDAPEKSKKENPAR